MFHLQPPLRTLVVKLLHNGRVQNLASGSVWLLPIMYLQVSYNYIKKEVVIMLSKEVLQLLGISRPTLTKYVKNRNYPSNRTSK